MRDACLLSKSDIFISLGRKSDPIHWLLHITSVASYKQASVVFASKAAVEIISVIKGKKTIRRIVEELDAHNNYFQSLL